jgi:hypothetical protein
MLSPEGQIIETMFRIADKDGVDVDFKLNYHQRQLDETVSGRDRIPKARQLGMSTYVLARFLAVCLVRKNTRAVVISHDTEASKKALEKVHYMISNMKGAKPVIKVSSKNEISFPKTNSVFYIGTAGSRQFGRGDTISHLHCSEVAFWPDPKKLVAGLYQAVPYKGEIFEESTGNGVGNYYHRQCTKSYEGASRFKLHFFNWIGVPEYRSPLSEMQAARLKYDLKEEWDEPLLYEEYNVELEQIQWRREKLEELDYDMRLLRQEYPVTLDECFQSTGFSLFPLVNFIESQNWMKYDGDERLHYDEKDFSRRSIGAYAIGVDVAGGVRRDRSVIEVVNLETNKQVAEWVSDEVPPDLLAGKIKFVAELYNNAFVTVESNNHGGMTIMALVAIYPTHLVYSHYQDSDKILEYGYRTTSKTKPLLIDNLRKEFTEGFTIQSTTTRDELSTFTETDKGKLEAEAGCFDDRVMALAICVMGAQKAFVKGRLDAQKRESITANVNPFSLEGIIAELHERHEGGGFPIAPQHQQIGDF